MDVFHTEGAQLLIDALMSLETKEEYADFLEDLLTTKEMLDMSQRVMVAKLLTEKKVYNKIATFLRWFILAFIIYQAATSTAGTWIALIIGFFILRFFLRLFISAVCLFCMAFIFIVLLSLLII